MPADLRRNARTGVSIAVGSSAILGACSAARPVAIQLPVKSCLIDPFKPTGSKEDGSTLNIVKGSAVGNSDPLEKSTAAIVASYKLKSGEKKGAICTGVVAGQNVILTAAHCFNKPADTVEEKYYITFKAKLTHLLEKEVIFVERVVVHPKYVTSGSAGNFDLLF